MAALSITVQLLIQCALADLERVLAGRTNTAAAT
jgi:hypothetical protein